MAIADCTLQRHEDDWKRAFSTQKRGAAEKKQKGLGKLFSAFSLHLCAIASE